MAEVAKAVAQAVEAGERRAALRKALSGQVGYIPDGEDLRHGTKYIRPVYLNKATIDALVAILVP